MLQSEMLKKKKTTLGTRVRIYLNSNFAYAFATGCSYQSDKNGGTGGGGGRDINAVKPNAGQYPGPQFDQETPRNVTALEGKSAYLTCKVKNLDNKTVRTKYIWHDTIVVIVVKIIRYTTGTMCTVRIRVYWAGVGWSRYLRVVGIRRPTCL